MERESERKSEGKGIREGSYREKGCVCVCVCVCVCTADKAHEYMRLPLSPICCG